MPVDHLANLLALRSVAFSLPDMVSSSEADLWTVPDGYARADGSFLADGFAVGMEVVPHGFPDAEPRSVSAVSPLLLKVQGQLGETAPAPGRSLTWGLPPMWSLENVPLPQGQPAAGRWYVQEQYLAGPQATRTLGAHAQVEADPMYVLTLHCPSGIGTAAPYRLADAVLRLFPPTGAIPLPSGDVIRVRSDPAPYRGQLVSRMPGRAMIVVTVPLMLRTANTI